MAGPLSPARLQALVAADALVRRHRQEGDDVHWAATPVAGGLGVQRAVENDLRHEGLEPSALDADELLARVRAAEDEAMARLCSVTEQLAVDLRFGHDGGPLSPLAARTAFVRLFDAGLVQLAEQVVDVCPHCRATVDVGDTVLVELPAESLVLRLALAAGVGEVHVRTLAPEFLPGTVAVVVPPGHPAAGASALVPLAGAEVPVLADQSASEPALVVPGHDPAALDLARRGGFTPVGVVGEDGVVQAEGPLDGLPRYAGRAAARELLDAEGALVGWDEAPEPAAQCRWCGTVLVPRVGHHWFLAMGDLEVAAADAVRAGRVGVWPAPARDELLATAGAGEAWCVARRLWTGQPVPVRRCLDCGRVDVSMEPLASCGSCMGEARDNGEVFDTRFLACAAALADAGWPGAPRRHEGPAATTTAVVCPRDLALWALPALGLGLWLTGEVPFDRVAVVPAGGVLGDDRADACVEAAALVEAEGRRVARAVLLGLGVEAARGLVAAVDAVPWGEGAAGDAALADACAAAFEAGAPGTVLRLAAGAVAAGVSPPVAAQVRALCAPVLGD